MLPIRNQDQSGAPLEDNRAVTTAGRWAAGRWHGAGTRADTPARHFPRRPDDDRKKPHWGAGGGRRWEGGTSILSFTAWFSISRFISSFLSIFETQHVHEECGLHYTPASALTSKRSESDSSVSCLACVLQCEMSLCIYQTYICVNLDVLPFNVCMWSFLNLLIFST